MADMQKKLKEMAEGHKKKMADLEERIKQKREAGQKQEAEELQRQLDRMVMQNQQMKQMEKMGEKLGECAKCLQEGKKEEALEGLEAMQANLNEMKQQLDEMEMLDAALDEISEAKNHACKAWAAWASVPATAWAKDAASAIVPRSGTDAKFHDSLVKQKTGKGAAIVTGFAEGPNAKGQVTQEISAQLEAAKSESADPLTDQRLPRDYRDHAKGYFDAFREGKKASNGTVVKPGE